MSHQSHSSPWLERGCVYLWFASNHIAGPTRRLDDNCVEMKIGEAINLLLTLVIRKFFQNFTDHLTHGLESFQIIFAFVKINFGETHLFPHYKQITH